MSRSFDDLADDRQDEQEEPEDPRLSALIEALAKGDMIDWQQAESSAGNEEEKERIRALAAISEVATFHRTWLAEGGIIGDLDEDEELDEAVPTHWGELEILERVGRGAFGDVYKAREPRLDRIVALKLIRASARTPEREAETLREGRLLAKVRHPNVATVYGAAGADGRVGFWMEFLEGKNLAEMLKEQGRFGAREAAEIGIALCRALAAVHAQGIIHRDVKAQNVVRENDGRIVLTDFGVGRDTAVIQSEEPSLSGTPLYLAPELFEGKPPSPASDLYALGVLLFYLVTGEFPVTGTSFDELRAAHQGRKRRWLKELRKELPGTFVAAVERALDRDSKKRAGVGELKRELGRFLLERLERRKRVRQALVSLLLLLLCAGGIGAFIARAQIATWFNLRAADRLGAAGKMQPAIDEVLEAKRRTPNEPGIYWRLMSYRSAYGDYLGSLEAARESEPICKDSRAWDCHMVRSWSAILRQDYEEAIKSFKAAQKIRPDLDTLKQIVMAQVNRVQPELAIADASNLRASEEPEMAEYLASTLSAAGNPKAAREALEELRGRFYDHPFYWLSGKIKIADGDAAGAEAEFREWSMHPDESGDLSTSQLLLAQALLFQSKFDEAQEVLVASSSLNKQEKFGRNDGVRSILRAKCFAKTEDFSQMSRLLKEVEELEQIPTYLKLFRNAALIALEGRDLSLASRLAKMVGDIRKRYPSALSESFDLELQGELAWREGNFDGAIDLLTEAHTTRDDPQNALSLARAYIAQNQCQAALPYLRSVVSRRGLIVEDFYTPWTIWNDANDLFKKCQAKGRKN